MIIKIFASIGLIVTYILVVVLVESIWSLIGYVVSEHRYNKQLKSRFDKAKRREEIEKER